MIPGRLGWAHSRKGGGEDPDLRGLLIESTCRLSNCPGLSLMEQCLPNRPFCTGRTKLRPDQGLETGSSQVGPTGTVVLFAGVLETGSPGVSIRTQCGNSGKDQSL